MSQDNGQKPVGRKLSELFNYGDSDPNELLKHRYLCRGGVLLFIGQTGIGKSSFTLQLTICFAIGKQSFEIYPSTALKTLLYQAENDDGDMAEIRDGIFAGLNLTEDEERNAGENIIVVHENSVSGDSFISSLDKSLAEHKPDLVLIDPVLSYLGGDTMSQKDVGGFLRNRLLPLLVKYQCGCILVHHTNKTVNNADTAYAGSGSAEYANMARAVLVLVTKDKDNSRFELLAVKRGGRLRWKMPDGKTKTLSKALKHSDEDEQIYWIGLNNEESSIITPLDKLQSDEQMILSCVPEDGAIEQSILIVTVKVITGLGRNKTQKGIRKMVGQGKLFDIKVPRTNARPEIHISRSPSKAVTGG